MGGPEDKARTDRAVRFFDALTDYYRLRPTLILALIHDIANDLVDTINAKEDLRRDLGYLIGQLHVLAYIIWVFDHLHIIEKMVANPDTHNDIMEAIMKTARAYYLLYSGEPITISNVANLIDGAVSRLYKLIATIINKANEAS